MTHDLHFNYTTQNQKLKMSNDFTLTKKHLSENFSFNFFFPTFHYAIVNLHNAITQVFRSISQMDG
jgi:hypothetical protein